ncbi:expressed unknown protein [Seminavis robusta]|uniref:Uncharacterized protein n=1 Tax=Seminavis robusta TaxID=568900 RepID=A0A9N8F567_9STRA|nr:expressed unknown protein [Seminavis robusta]CAB9531089.1 expressed unknown protein [Seminavis robusta]|eukprot:Sro2097_g314360.1 n/a (144) ;mRNA; r:16407-16838
MPLLRTFHRSHSLSDADKAYRRAARELRDFHRARSLDVILEEAHDHDDDPSHHSHQGMLQKKRACLCLADLVVEDDVDGSEHSAPEEHTKESGSGGNNTWGHFTADSPAVATEQEHHHHDSSSRVYPASITFKGRIMRPFGRS